MKKLLIVESPAKIKTISKFLGKNFKIMSTLGHVKDLPKREVGVTMNDSITLDYVVLENKDKTLAELCREASNADEIYLAPDPDREGEIIAFHVAQELLKVVKDPSIIHRITFNEITQPAIEAAIGHPSTIDKHMVAAQQARRVLDRWVGYEVSPVLWKKIKRGLSAGRVQSVALRLICDREDAIRGFKPEEYWDIDGLFGLEDATVSATLVLINGKKAEFSNKAGVDPIVKDLPKQSYVVTSIKDSKRLKNPAAPFMTSSLQQAAFNRLGFSVQKTMNVAQKLYEGVSLADKNSPVALITYMRTDSLRISDTALKQSREFIAKHFAADYLPTKSPVYSKEKAQDAHEAIRPVNVEITPEMVKPYVEPDFARLYELIWRRFVACQMKPALYAQRQVVITGGPYTFKVTGSTLLFDGFLRVYEADEDEKTDTKVLPAGLMENKNLILNKVDPKQHFTQPPPRYTEASLVKEMEKAGIGRPSTYATILKTIQAREYTELDTKKRFTPTELGMVVTKMLGDNLPRIMDIAFTAHMEEDLDKIAQGTLERDKLLRSFYEEFSKEVKNFAGEQVERPIEQTDITCPSCKEHKLIVRWGKAGAFLGCAGFPECTFSSNFKRTAEGGIELLERQEPQLLDEKCPQCGKALQRRVGRFGPFVSCSGYPECKYIKQEKSSFNCPGCGKGKMVKRTWKGKVFWSCERYPDCNYTIPSEIEETPCPKCDRPYQLKRTTATGEVLLVCHDRACSGEAEPEPKKRIIRKSNVKSAEKKTTTKKTTSKKSAPKKK